MERPFHPGRCYGLILLLILFSLIATATAQAQTTTWTGAGATDNWSDAGNWSSGPPGSGYTVYFASVGGDSYMDISGLSLNSLLMNTASWSGTLIFQENLTVNNTSVLTSDVQLQNRQLTANYILEIAAGCTLDTGTGSVTASGNLLVNGAVTGSGALSPLSQIFGSSTGSINGGITIVAMAGSTDLSDLSSVNMTGGGFSTTMGGSLALPAGAILGDYGYSGAGGSLSCVGGTAQIMGNFVAAGDLDIGSGSLDIYGPVTIGGIVYNGTGAQTYTFHDDITINSGALQITAGGATLNFGGDTVIDVAGGAAFFVSAWEANRCVLQQDGTAGGSQWTLSYDPAATVSITGAEIQDGNATPPLTVLLCLNNGNNTGFIFPSDISVYPDTLDFGPVELSTTSAETLMVYNTATGTLHVTGVSAGTPYFVPATTVFDVAPGDSQLVRVDFTPLDVGAYEDTLTIFSDDPVDSILTVPMEGLGAGADLVRDWAAYPGGVTHGYETVTVNMGIKNQGHRASGVFRVSLRLSADAGITSDDPVAATVTVADIPAGGDTSLTLAGVLPKSAIRGDVYIGTYLDDLDQVAEYDENNNTESATFYFWAPVVYSVRDIPGDQGGYVYLSWYASAKDPPAGGATITQYSIWRAMSAAAASSLISDAGVRVIRPGDPIRADGSNVVRMEKIAGQTFFWHPVDTTGAYHLDSYGYPEPTMFDSTSSTWEYNYYQVIAHTSDDLVFYISAPDSGYSVDDLAPAMPANLAGDQSEAEGLQLTWDANSETDLANYAVYRGTDGGFEPSEGNLLSEPVEPALFDGEWRWDGGYHYKVAAVDIHGNVSVFATLDPDLVSGAEHTGPPVAYYLGRNRPNPFNRTTRISFGLARPGPVTLRIYDVRGRMVRELASGFHRADVYALGWDGRDDLGRYVPAGVYFCRLTAGGFIETRKLTLVK